MKTQTTKALNSIEDWYAPLTPIDISLISTLAISVFLCWVILTLSHTKIIKNISNLTHSSFAHFISMGLGIIWASSVSVFGTELKEQIFGSDDFSKETLVFTASVSLALIIGILHYIRGLEKEREGQSRACYAALSENSLQCINMSTVINDCLKDYRTLMNQEKKSPGEIFDKNPKVFNQTLDNAINTAMQSILRVTKKFIEGSEHVHIKANLFNLVPSNSVLNCFKEKKQDSYKHETNSILNEKAILNSPLFLFGTNLQSRLERCDYLLVCEQTFTCQLDKKNVFKMSPKEEKELPLCMPYSVEEANEFGTVNHPNLFGAPEAVAQKRDKYIDYLQKNVDEYIKALENSVLHGKHMTKDFESSLRDYYEKDTDRPKSILSIPVDKLLINIDDYSIPRESEQIACVLNIYINRENFLESELKSQTYSTLIQQLRYHLAILISLKILYNNQLTAYNSKNEK